ncbi:MAG: hypothetical protein GY745_16180 [Actinomycetia bacterium]|nr:hypothetical protein [Actinomycetes bacterium]MCP4086571.1 hypothetical protein [Actinomycetes bacterium]
MDSVKEAQTRSIDQMKTVQEQVISFNERIADSVLSAVPSFASPFADYLPKPSDVVDSYFDFMNEMHEANRDFAARMTGIWDRAEDTAPEAKAADKK